MASFDIAYEKYIKPNEGGYAHVANDKGGETYAGIARNFYPNWPGWTYIDFIKRTSGPIANNTLFPNIQYMVDEFYLDRWNSNRFGEINSQPVANLLFDFHVHSRTNAIRGVQQLVGVSPDGIMGPVTIGAINSADSAELHDQLKAYRVQYLEGLVKADPTLAVFLKAWLKRVARFPTLVTQNALKVGGAIIALGVIVAGYVYSQRMATA